MQIDRQLIQHLAELAHLHPSPDREDDLLAQLQRLVDAFSTLGAAELEEPAHATASGGSPSLAPETLRVDHCEPSPDPAQVLANAPQTAADCFVVPRVVEP